MVRGKGEIYNESGNLVREFRFDGNKHHSTTGLEPGTNYTLVIPEVGFHTMPTVTTGFDPGQTDNVEIFTIPDFNSTETFQWQWRHISFRFIDDETLKLKESEIEDLQRNEFQLVGNGTYDEGDWTYRWNYKWIYPSDDHVPSRAVNISGDLRYRDFNGNWIKPTHDIGFSQHPDHRPSFRPVIDGIFGMDNFTLEYVGTRRLNESTVPEPLRVKNWSAPEEIKGEEVLVFNITHWGYSERINGTYYFDNESQARIFVDRETGHVLRYQARERLSVGVGYADKYIGENPSIHVIDFYNHGDSGVEINPKDYPPYREE
ncbi:hypothetical protein SAMN05216226_101229 [Halovenus aranensis]|uniref:Uncharacterized protein n=2 Tax=Halovenus aranensis TaxID=890420 RepID=A0A1G8S146_9EURY|nr:hypothetical protein SAMN05216226_101229 [Halovenus aranensis]